VGWGEHNARRDVPRCVGEALPTPALFHMIALPHDVCAALPHYVCVQLCHMMCVCCLLCVGALTCP